MLLTKKTEYAILALILIAKSDVLLNVDTLSQKLNIPKYFLAKILQHFSKEGIVKSHKGVKGGFLLNQNPSEISILKISLISEQKAPAVFECSPSKDSCPSNQANDCTLWPVLHGLQHKIDDFLDSLTLEDILV